MLFLCITLILINYFLNSLILYFILYWLKPIINSIIEIMNKIV
jgi:hypothetical protein